MEFDGFPRATMEFLEDLGRHNDRAWFRDHRDRWERDVVTPALAFLESLETVLARIAPRFHVKSRRSGGSLGRMARPGGSKPPFHTHVAILVRHGEARKRASPAFGVFFGPQGVIVAVGMPTSDAKALREIRREIDRRPDDWRAVRDGLVTGNVLDLDPSCVRGAPRGFPADHPLIGDLRRTAFSASRRHEPDLVHSQELGERVERAFEDGRPLVKFLCDALALPF